MEWNGLFFYDMIPQTRKQTMSMTKVVGVYVVKILHGTGNKSESWNGVGPGSKMRSHI